MELKEVAGNVRLVVVAEEGRKEVAILAVATEVPEEVTEVMAWLASFEIR